MIELNTQTAIALPIIARFVTDLDAELFSSILH
jgi:hypothetical protein